MTDLPAPLTPPDCDLRELKYMPFHVQRFRDSTFNCRSSGAEFKAGFMLYLVAWHQVPAASLPDDGKALAKLSGAGRKWKRLRSMALHGWVKCSDGRLYHPFIAELALKAWAGRLRLMRKRDRRLEMESGEWVAIRTIVFARDDYTCRYCAARGVKLECDHIIPVADGGPTVLENLVTACRRCNRSKGSKSLKDWAR